jgi:hypothetical protein
MVPAVHRQGADLVVTGEPLEAVQLQARGAVDELRREGRAALALKQHQRAPVLFGVAGLLGPKKFHRLAGQVLVLHDHQRVALIAQLPELGDIAASEHVAVHEDRPAAVLQQAGTRKREKENSVL